ncbi:Clp protease N-terminal domain-containing protein [Sphaerisporangium aureirubrum]|uniref:Clp protease N-terminal domain-containing protein n=1 Tax=Sphaerisporangium aureirubrum TaxID=1544736 RepID=A0ABW1NRL2_9ACTN
MPKINVYLPDELAEAVKEAGVPVSAVCQRALEQAVRRITAIRVTAFGDLDAEDPTGRLSQFTDRARTVLKLAVKLARADKAPTVGTEHLLAGMLAEGSNLALHVLRAIDIDPIQLAGVIPLTAGPEDGEPARHFSAQAAAVLELTVSEATGLGHNYVGCEHLLLGLVAEPDGTAGQILRGRGADPRLTRHAVTAALAGYVHLRAQTTPQAAPAAPQAVPQGAREALTAAVRAELQPLITRIERLESQAGLTDAP